MRRIKTVALAVATVALTWASPAQAWVDISLGGMCSVDFSDGKGSGFAGDWGGGVINARVDQRGTMETAAGDFYNILNENCRTQNCYIYNYSAGDAVVGYVLDNYDMSGINLVHVYTAGGAGGGSDLAGDIAGSLTCSYANLLTENSIRGLYDHNQNIVPIYRTGGYKKLFESGAACVAGSVLSVLTLGWVDNHCLTGNHDGAVEFHSAGAYSSIANWSRLYDVNQSHWQGTSYWIDNYRSFYNDVGDNLNHYEIKMWGICLDGGAWRDGGPNGSSYSACKTWCSDRA